MFRLPTRAYVFHCPPDSDWLPSRDSMFEEKPSCANVLRPSAQEIFSPSKRLKSDWDNHHEQIRRLLAELARNIVFV